MLYKQHLGLMASCVHDVLGALQRREGLPPRVSIVADGERELPLGRKHITMIKGDSRCLAVASASIIAKCLRDDYMDEVALRYPGYEFEKNKGYGSNAHADAIHMLGLCPEHRVGPATKAAATWTRR